MVAPNDEADNTDTGHGQHHRFVAEDGATSRGCQHFGHDTEGGDNDHVHFGVAEEPEQMLEEQRIAARHEELRTDGVVKQKEGDTDDQRR